ncbi:uncharacterized protein K02A2.6-like [Wyeomyia smithii]|uniref:uncharacterized protein K02A2.6-like n=1 Tax=Wyeomyia smithii TaxID=174621 RepID=UPI002467C8EC|nr:uncharacterized protein K02A2.6-like [Wyeomyia smithii]
MSPLVLTHYNPQLDIVASADASSIGIGARIAHRFPNGTVKAICHASRSLTPAETNYSQIEKEGLQRWALTLLLCNFSIEYVSTNSFGYEDLLSRLMNTHFRPDEEYVIASIELESTFHDVVNQSLEVFPLTFKSIQAETRAVPVLQKVLQHVQQGWPTKKTDVAGSCQQFYLRKDGLSVIPGCLLYGERLIIPSKYQKKVLQLLHKGHPGVERMRAVARSNCARVAKTNTRTNLESWLASKKPWQRLHIDYAGPVDGWFYLIPVDAYSKWPEVVRTRQTTSPATIEILEGIFARFGNPETLVCYNGRQFIIEQFEEFCDTKAEGEGLTEAINTFLLCYRSTPCRSAPEGKSPAEIKLGRTIRASLDLLRPPTAFHKTDHSKQDDQYIVQPQAWNSVSDVDEAEIADKRQPTQVPLDILLESWGLDRSPADETESIFQSNPYAPPGNKPVQPDGLPPNSNPRLNRKKKLQRQPLVTRQSSRSRRYPVRYDPYHLYY